MCNQISNLHLCGHISCGPLMYCGVSVSCSNCIYQSIYQNPSLCETCYFTIFNYRRLLAGLPQLVTTSPATMLPTQTYSTPQEPPPPYVPPSPRNGIIPAGMVPKSVPREIRYEVIQGKLQKIEHFKAEDIGICQGGSADITTDMGGMKGLRLL